MMINLMAEAYIQLATQLTEYVGKKISPTDQNSVDMHPLIVDMVYSLTVDKDLQWIWPMPWNNSKTTCTKLSISHPKPSCQPPTTCNSGTTGKEYKYLS